MSFILKTYSHNPMQCNQYLVLNQPEGLLIDATSPLTEGMLKELKGLKSITMLYTHCHFDHIAFGFVQQQQFEKMGIKVTSFAHLAEQSYYGEQGKPALVGAYKHYQLESFYTNPNPPVLSRFIETEEELGFDDFKVMFTPGHSPGGMVIYSPEHKIMFTGDTLFTGGSFGRVDFEGGNYREMRQSLIKLFAMDNDYTIYPGHGSSGLLQYEKKAGWPTP